jgi:Protein of unknown function (DUF1573)
MRLYLFWFVTLGICCCTGSTKTEIIKQSQDTTVLRLKTLPDSLLTRIVIEPYIYQYDTITYGEKIKGRFTIKNIGAKNFKIEKLVARCECTELTISDSTIAPGRETYLEFEVSTKKLKPSAFNESIISLFGNFKPYFRTIKIEGYIAD